MGTDRVLKDFIRRIGVSVFLLVFMVGVGATAFAGVKVDETNKPNEKGFIVTIGTDTAIPKSMAPNLTISIWNERGSRSLYKMEVTKENYDEDLGEYQVVFPMKNYKVGNEFLLNLDSAESMVTQLLYYDDVKDRYYDIIDVDVSPILIKKEKLYFYDKDTDYDLVLTGTDYAPYNITLVTDETKVRIQCVDEEGLPLGNQGFTLLRDKDKKKMTFKTDGEGMITADKTFFTRDSTLNCDDPNLTIKEKLGNRILVKETKEEGALYKKMVFRR